jgi:hypothetical protein
VSARWPPTTCEFCHTNSKQEPCSRPAAEHRTGIEIHEGPDRWGTYMYTRFWWNESWKRQRAQVFRAEPPNKTALDAAEWRAAWIVYRKD